MWNSGKCIVIIGCAVVANAGAQKWSVVSSSPTPAPTPAPVDSTPSPIDSTPTPADPTLAPMEPTPVPVDATPAPVDPPPTPAPLVPTVPPTPASLVPPSPSTPSKQAPATILTVQLTPKDLDGCMRVNATDDSLLLASCVGPPEPRSQLFELAGINRIRAAINLNKCLQAGADGIPMEGTPVILADCDPDSAYQKFTFDATNGGSIKLAFLPEYCVAFSSDSPSLDEEPLIMSLCDDLTYLGNGWEVKN